MKNITLVAVALVSTLTVGAFAHGTENHGTINGQNMMGNQGSQNQYMQNRQGMMNAQGIQNKYMQNRQGMMAGQGMGMMGGGMMGGQGMGMMNGMQMFSQLNLNEEQRFQFSILRDEMRLEMKKQLHGGQQMGQIGKFIKNNTFNKKAFEKYMDEKHTKMLDLKINTMEKAFKLLTNEQISKLKKISAHK